MQAYSEDQIKAALAEPDHQGWQLETATGQIYREFKLGDFLKAIAFVNQVATIAEQLGHHPDILIKYNRVKLSVNTHDAPGLTTLDFQLANQVNQLAI